jgi:hypothetical protein
MHCEACAMEIKKRMLRMKGMTIFCFLLLNIKCLFFFYLGPFAPFFWFMRLWLRSLQLLLVRFIGCSQFFPLFFLFKIISPSPKRKQKKRGLAHALLAPFESFKERFHFFISPLKSTLSF